MAELGINAKGWDDIDKNDPQISLEWKLCDPANIMMIQSERTRQKFLDTLNEGELAYLCSDPDT